MLWSLWALLGWLSPVHAQEPLRVTLAEPLATMLRDRIAGQIADLPVVVVAESEASDIVVRFEALTPLGWRVHTLDVRHAQTQTRTVDGDTSAQHAQSALDEATALVVRTTLQALIAGEAVANDATTSTHEAARPDAIAASSSSHSTAPRASDAGSPVIAVVPTPIASDKHAGWHLWAGLGGSLAIADTGAHLWPRADLWLGVATHRWSVGVLGGFAPDTQVTQPIADVAIARHALLLIGDVQGWRHGALSVGARLQAGAVVYTRSTTRTAGGWQASADVATWTPTLGVALSAGIALSPGLGLHVQLGADGVARRLSVSARGRDGSARALLRTTWVAPRATVGLELTL